MKEWFTNPTSR